MTTVPMPFGPWHPDAAALNAEACIKAHGCRPAPNGCYYPMPQIAPSTGALDGTCLGALVLFDAVGAINTFAGDASKLYKLASDQSWSDVSRATGGAYSSGSGSRWQFGYAGGLVAACTIGEQPQKFVLGASTRFEPLGGTPPKAAYIATVRDFVVLGGLNGNLNTIHWSGLGEPEHWTVGTKSCDTQTFQSGGPVRGIIGGEVGYIFQAQAITRMTFVPGSDAIFQMDVVESGRGLAAPYSLVRIGSQAFFLATDGFYRFDCGAASAVPIGVGKWSRTFLADLNAGLIQNVVGSVDPVGRYIIWAYPTRSVAGAVLNRCLIYDWTLEEATTVDMSVSALAQMMTQGVTIDTMDDFGSLDELPFSLDSSVWQGGASLLAVFGSDNKMSYLTGAPMAAQWVSNDLRLKQRFMLRGVRPHIDTAAATAAIAMREAEYETPTFGPDESNDDSGNISTWGAGNFGRVRLSVPAGAQWSKFTGAEINIAAMGKR